MKLSTIIKVLGFITISILLKLSAFGQTTPVKRVFVEEGTGTWCGWCVKGIVYMDSLEKKYQDSWIGISVHINDPMANPNYQQIYNSKIAQAIPSGTVDRKYLDNDGFYGTQVEDFEEIYLKSIEETPPANVYIDSIIYDESNRKLSFDVKAVFFEKVSNYRLNAIIVEDDVKGQGAEWAQTNYYEDNSNGEMGGFESLPDPVPADQMTYHNVARAILGGWDGVPGSLPIHVLEGATHRYRFEVDIDNTWNMDNISMVGLLINRTTGEVKNATSKNFKETTNITSLLDKKELKVFPNPCYDKITLSGFDKGIMKIYNTNGKLVLQKAVNVNNSSIDLNLNPGMYYVWLKSENSVTTRKLIVIK